MYNKQRGAKDGTVWNSTDNIDLLRLYSIAVFSYNYKVFNPGENLPFNATVFPLIAYMGQNRTLWRSRDKSCLFLTLQCWLCYIPKFKLAL